MAQRSGGMNAASPSDVQCLCIGDFITIRSSLTEGILAGEGIISDDCYVSANSQSSLHFEDSIFQIQLACQYSASKELQEYEDYLQGKRKKKIHQLTYKSQPRGSQQQKQQQQQHEEKANASLNRSETDSHSLLSLSKQDSIDNNQNESYLTISSSSSSDALLSSFQDDPYFGISRNFLFKGS